MMPETATNLAPQAENAQPRLLAADQLPELLQILQGRGYDVVGPTMRDGAIVLDRLESAAEIASGWIDEQRPAQYRLRRADGQSVFSYGVGPQSWKKYLHPAETKLWSAEKQNQTFRILNNEPATVRPLAFFGVRACDLAAIAVQDRVFLEGKYRDPIYSSRRRGLFIIAVQCTRANETCFCASMGTGPRLQGGFDLALTELAGGSTGHRFVVQSGSRRGAGLIAELQTTAAGENDVLEAESAIDRAARQQVRRIDTARTREALQRNFEHPRWDQVVQRCLSCANCTMVCPTCFCTNVEDTSDISGNHAERWRRWDSCFSLNFSYIHGGSVRASAKSRYRQWISHKLAWWIDQFGTSGCVGCGRCITWCPVGIDITEEAGALCQGEKYGNS
ncbi:MAG: 4Fe-4S dicluster domain-containing protein [Actinomycetota bacterium]